MTTIPERYVDPHEDRRIRFRPSPAAVQAAVASLETHPDAEAVVVPMYMPGKTYNCWTVGQRVLSVELPASLMLLGVTNRRPESQLPTIDERRQEAFDLAMAALAEHGHGTTAYAVVRRDGSAMVFEEILSAR